MGKQAKTELPVLVETWHIDGYAPPDLHAICRKAQNWPSAARMLLRALGIEMGGVIGDEYFGWAKVLRDLWEHPEAVDKASKVKPALPRIPAIAKPVGIVAPETAVCVPFTVPGLLSPAEDDAAATRFLRALYGQYETGYIEMRAFEPKRLGGEPKRRGWYSVVDTLRDPGQILDDAFEWAKHYEVYVGVLPRGRHGKGRKPDIYEAAVAWAELDFDKQPGGEAGTLIRAQTAQPDIMVRSGGGVHLYWHLSTRVPLTVETRERFERSLTTRQRQLDADSTADVTRILRIPGTFNHKLADPRKVVLLHAH